MEYARTLVEKIWDRHAVVERPEGRSLLYIDRHLVHDGGFHAFEMLRKRGLGVARPRQTFGTADHYVPTVSRRPEDAPSESIALRIDSFARNMAEFGIDALTLNDPRQGIVHVVGPEQGLTLPGLIIVCGDSHTSTHGALGAFAFGIGQSENAHVLATQTLWQKRPRRMRIIVDGALAPGVAAKDVILAIIAKIGAAGAVGHVIEYAGSAISASSIEQRLTICNMSIEAGARAGIIAPDETVFTYLHGRPFAPKGALWDRAVAYWRTLRSDQDAAFECEVALDARNIVPMVTWGTSLEDALPISGIVPDPNREPLPGRRERMNAALGYMGLCPALG